jgi:Tfp pilus assembly protein PilW
MKNGLVRRSGGFTLIELIIYLAVMSLMIVGLVNWSLSISGSERRAVVGSELYSGGRLVAEKITREVRQAVSVSTPVIGVSDVLTKLDLGSGNVSSLGVNNGRLILTTMTGSWPITSEQLVVKSFVVTNRSSTALRPHLDFEVVLAYRGEDSREFAVAKTFNFSASGRR